jgi:hypothetical protein
VRKVPEDLTEMEKNKISKGIERWKLLKEDLKDMIA